MGPRRQEETTRAWAFGAPTTRRDGASILASLPYWGKVKRIEEIAGAASLRCGGVMRIFRLSAEVVWERLTQEVWFHGIVA